MVLFLFFFVFKLAPVHVRVETDFILNVITFSNLLPIFSSSVTAQALQAVRTVVYVLYYLSYRWAECFLLILQVVYVYVPLVLPHDLRQRLSKLFSKGTGSKYFRFSWLYSQCSNYSLLTPRCSHRQYINKWGWLCASKT